MQGSQRGLTLRFLAEPTDVNFGGKVFGGAVMKWIDQAAYALAVAWSGRYAVTDYVGAFISSGRCRSATSSRFGRASSAPGPARCISGST